MANNTQRWSSEKVELMGLSCTPHLHLDLSGRAMCFLRSQPTLHLYSFKRSPFDTLDGLRMFYLMRKLVTWFFFSTVLFPNTIFALAAKAHKANQTMGCDKNSWVRLIKAVGWINTALFNLQWCPQFNTDLHLENVAACFLLACNHRMAVCVYLFIAGSNDWITQRLSSKRQQNLGIWSWFRLGHKRHNNMGKKTVIYACTSKVFVYGCYLP